MGDFAPNLPGPLMPLVAVGIIVFFVSALVFGILPIAVAEAMHAKKRKIFYDKISLQIAQCLTAIALCFCGIFTALFAGALLTHGLTPDFLLIQGKISGLEALLIACIGFLLFLFVHQRLRKQPLWRWGFATCLAVAMLVCAGFFVSTAVESRTYLPIPQPHALWSISSLLSLFNSAFAYVLPVGLAIIPSLSQLWLILRRNRANYGRDYYNFAMHSLARWSLAGILAGTALTAAYIFFLKEYRGAVPPPMCPHQIWLFTAAVGLPAIACLLWSAQLTSATPMRHKLGVCLAFLLLCGTLCVHLIIVQQYQGLAGL